MEDINVGTINLNVRKVVSTGKAYYDLYDDGTLDITMYKPNEKSAIDNITKEMIIGVNLKQYPFEKEVKDYTFTYQGTAVEPKTVLL